MTCGGWHWGCTLCGRSHTPQASSRKLEEVEAEIDLESAKLWNLSAPDLAEIQRSLKELTE